MQNLDGLVLLDAEGNDLGRLKSYYAGIEVEFEVPSSQRPSQYLRGLSVRYEGACGTIELPLGAARTIYTEETMDSNEWILEKIQRRHRIEIGYVATDASTEKVSATPILISWGEAFGELQIGETTVPAGVEQTSVSLRGCAQSVPVRHGVQTIGELPHDFGQPFISVDPGACHRYTSMFYGELGTPRTETYEGAMVMNLPSRITDWLRPVPETIRVTRSPDPSLRPETGWRTSLELIGCPATEQTR